MGRVEKEKSFNILRGIAFASAVGREIKKEMLEFINDIEGRIHSNREIENEIDECINRVRRLKEERK